MSGKFIGEWRQPLKVTLQNQPSQLYHLASAFGGNLLEIFHVVLGARNQKNLPRIYRFSLSSRLSHSSIFYPKRVVSSFI